MPGVTMNNECRSRMHLAWLVGMTLLILSITVISCSPRYKQGESEEIIHRFSLARMYATDLPFGWGNPRTNTPDEPGAVGRTIVYHGGNPRTEQSANVSQDIHIYIDEEGSKSAYVAKVSQEIPPAHADKWIQPAELVFKGYADEITIAFLPGNVNGMKLQSCVVVARYGDMVGVLRGNVFENRWMTMIQFRRLVERVDKHMNDARLP
jgi:hypothetical protein